MEWSRHQTTLSTKTPLMHRQGVDGDGDGDGGDACCEEGAGSGEGGAGEAGGTQQHALLSETTDPRPQPAADDASVRGTGWLQLKVAGAPTVPSGPSSAPSRLGPQQQLPVQDSGTREAASVLVGGLAWQDIEAVPFTDPVTGKEVRGPLPAYSGASRDPIRTFLCFFHTACYCCFTHPSTDWPSCVVADAAAAAE